MDPNLSSTPPAGQTPSAAEIENQILAVLGEWRERTLNAVLAVASLAGGVAILVLFFNALQQPSQMPFALTFLGIYAVVLFLTLRRTINYRTRGMIFLALVYLGGILTLARRNGAPERALAEDLAARIAIQIESAQLFAAAEASR